MSRTGRLEHLLAKIKARTNSAGEPHGGFAQNVAALRAEVDMIQENMGASKNGDAR